MKVFLTITGILLVLSIMIIGNTQVAYSLATEARIKEQCLGYERSGNIPTGSCACSEQLYDTWEESYNWMDACGIVEARG